MQSHLIVYLIKQFKILIMKKITFLFLILISFTGVAQQVVIQNFETPTSFGPLNAFAGMTASIQPDPVVGGTRINSLNLVSSSTGQFFQGCEIVQLVNRFKLTTDKTMSIDVYSTVAFTLLAKVEGGQGAPNSGASQSYTTPGQWQTLTFTFTQGLDGTATANGNYGNLVLFPNWNPNNSGFINPPGNFSLFVDNITSEASPILPDPVPTTAAPTPPNRPAADVKSIFSDAYTPIATLNYAGADGPLNDNTFNTSWCGASTNLIQIEGNNTNRVTGLGCEGISFLSGRFDATSFTKLHIDVWTPTPTQDKVLTIKLSNWNNTAGETSAIIIAATNAPPALLPTGSEGTWISLDIPLSSFVGASVPANLSRNDIAQLVLEGNLGTIFYDNLYLHKDTTLDTNSFEVASVKLYPNPATTVLNIESAAAIEKVSIFNLLGQEVVSQTPNSNQTTLDVAQLQVGVYIVKASVNGTVSSTRFIKD